MKNTLQARLIILMVLSSIFLISTFTIIQLSNQLQRSAEFNLYRANFGAFVTKDKLKDLFSGFTEQPPSYLIVPKIREIFSSEMDSRIIEGATLFNREGLPLLSEGRTITNLQYDKAFLDKIYQMNNKSKWLFPVINKKERIIDLFVALENSYGYVVRLTFALGSLQQTLADVYVPVMFTIIIVIIANVILATLLSHTLISPVKILNEATKDIAMGNLDRKVSINTKDELEELADTFNYMTIELKKMKEKAENANPLTKLPGNIVIQEEVEKRMKNNEKFILIYSDLDNFKAFNDKYGVHAGDKIIMLNAEVLKEAIAKNGAKNDFIGHEGGDDFLLLTTPERAQQIADYIIKEFDKHVLKFYHKEDLELGYIESKARDSDEIVKFPIMTISLAGVSNLKREIVSYSQLTNIAAEVKKLAKEHKGSIFIMDRREQNLGIEGRNKP